MPRNVEDLIERHIEEDNLPLLVLTIAIQEGLDVPEEVLKEFGSGYGPDNFDMSNEYYIRRKEQMELDLEELSCDYVFSLEELNNAREEKFNRLSNNYEETVKRFEFKLKKIRKMLEEIKKLSINNRKQEDFKESISTFLLLMSGKMAKDYQINESKPKLESLSEVFERLQKERSNALNEAKDFLSFYNNLVKFDDTFFVELIKDWFDAGKLSES